MSDDTLLTLRQLGVELDLPESTVRYYRDAFFDHIPSVGTGRRRRYPPQAIAVLRTIAKGYASGQSKSDLLRSLDQHSPRGASVA
ncbi:MAG: MerR family transcriptional regulator, partial [Gemmatimonadales bacterium]|nr:MerR family transcriptional regulator [Gemmatimonadales bacterium]